MLGRIALTHVTRVMCACVSRVVAVVTAGDVSLLYTLLGDAVPELHRWMKATLYALMSCLTLQALVVNQWMRTIVQQETSAQMRMCMGTWCVVSREEQQQPRTV